MLAEYKDVADVSHKAEYREDVDEDNVGQQIEYVHDVHSCHFISYIGVRCWTETQIVWNFDWLNYRSGC